MRNILVIMCLLVLMGCGDDKPSPTGTNAAFIGITPTDDTGNLTGTVDGSDWQVETGQTALPVDRSNIIGWHNPSGKIGAARKVLPEQFAVKPGFPNPTKGQFTVAHEIPAGCVINTWVLNASLTTVYREQLTAGDAGNWAVFLDFTGGENPLPGGMYRVVYEFDLGDQVLHGYGDVLYITRDEQDTTTSQD